MEFAWNGQQLFSNSFVKVKSGKDDAIRNPLHILREDTSIQETLKNRPEYLLEVRLRRFRQAQDHMVSDISLIKFISASTRGGSATNNSRINYLFPEQLLSIVETLIVNEVTKEFNSRLCSLLFQLRHVDIIYKNGNGLVGSCTEQGFSLFVQFGFNGKLGLLGLGLGGEVKEDSYDIMLSFGEQERDCE